VFKKMNAGFSGESGRREAWRGLDNFVEDSTDVGRAYNFIPYFFSL
jgi:hypothetical protein